MRWSSIFDTDAVCQGCRCLCVGIFIAAEGWPRFMDGSYTELLPLGTALSFVFRLHLFETVKVAYIFCPFRHHFSFFWGGGPFPNAQTGTTPLFPASGLAGQVFFSCGRKAAGSRINQEPRL